MFENIINFSKESKVDFTRLMYEEKEEAGGFITNEFKKELEERNIDKIMAYDEFNILLHTLTDNKKDIQEKMQKAFDNYNEMVNIESSSYTEHYYKEGVKDGVRLIIECLR